MEYVCAELSHPNHDVVLVFIPRGELRASQSANGNYVFGWGETCKCLVLAGGTLYELEKVGVGHCVGGTGEGIASYDFLIHSSRVKAPGLPIGYLEITLRAGEAESDWAAKWKRAPFPGDFIPYRAAILPVMQG